MLAIRSTQPLSPGPRLLTAFRPQIPLFNPVIVSRWAQSKANRGRKELEDKRNTSPLNELHEEQEEDERTYGRARKWLETLGPDSIPKDECEITMSRSSGPGGQHVNKTQSKATLRVPWSALQSRVPPLLHIALKEHHWWAPNSQSLVISADGSRNGKQNANDCYQKLNELLRETGRLHIRGETSFATRVKVLKLEQAGKARKEHVKKHASQKKQSRKFDSRGD